MLEHFSIREIQDNDIKHVVNYWQTATTAHLNAMGVERSALHVLNNLEDYIAAQMKLPYHQKSALYTIGLLNSKPYGHCYVNSIEYGKEAHMHLHVWQSKTRQKGLGATMVKNAVTFFFDRLKLQQLICEPYALNPAPNKTLAKLGFQLEKCYTSTPSGWDFKLKVNRWKIKALR